MKFSYKLIKEFIPKLKNKAQPIDVLTMYSFEAEEAQVATKSRCSIGVFV